MVKRRLIYLFLKSKWFVANKKPVTNNVAGFYFTGLCSNIRTADACAMIWRKIPTLSNISANEALFDTYCNITKKGAGNTRHMPICCF